MFRLSLLSMFNFLFQSALCVIISSFYCSNINDNIADIGHSSNGGGI